MSSYLCSYKIQTLYYFQERGPTKAQRPRACGSRNTARNPWCSLFHARAPSPLRMRWPASVRRGEHSPVMHVEERSTAMWPLSPGIVSALLQQLFVAMFLEWWVVASTIFSPTSHRGPGTCKKKAPQILKILMSLCVLFECVVWKSSQAIQILTPPLTCPAGRVFLISHPL